MRPITLPDVTASPQREIGTTRGQSALLVVLVVVASFMLPGGGLLVTYGSRLFGVPAGGRTRVLLVVAIGLLLLQVAVLAFVFLAPTEVCSSFDGGPTTCTTG